MQKVLLLTICLLFLSASCSIFDFNKSDLFRVKNGKSVDIKKYPEINSSVIMGKIDLPPAISQNQQAVVISAYPAKVSGKKKDVSSHHSILDRTDEFMLYLPAGDYYLYVFADLNNDFLFKENEVIGTYGKPDIIHLTDNEIKSNINLKIVNGITKLPSGFSVEYNYESVEYIGKNGQVRKLYSEIFSPDNAKIGWWHPSLFMKAFGANIYLTEDYNPKKIPVLFVHGAQGSPHDFANLYVRLRKSDYQLIFFYYPSGMRLPMLSELLYLKINNLKSVFGFKKMYLIAHSMGGLVSRSMITNYYSGYSVIEKKYRTDNYIKAFITLATPWSGFGSANAGLKTSPYVIPSWIDVSEQSMFIKTNLKKNIPRGMDYYLFYGKLDKTSKGRALDSRVYSEAKGIYGYNADHNSILTEKEVIDKLMQVLKGNR
ncbi:MAG: hypothetical protein JW864_10720 [Spirochaetes bacterium]|nr:hypothetical protein [Spirochaetota bacterium]